MNANFFHIEAQQSSVVGYPQFSFWIQATLDLCFYKEAPLLLRHPCFSGNAEMFRAHLAF